MIGTIEVTPPGKLRLTVFVSVLKSDPSQEAEVYELAVGESADSIVDHIDSLIEVDKSERSRGVN